MGAIFEYPEERTTFEARLRLALQPAPELRVISHHIVTKIHAHLHRRPGAPSAVEAEPSERRRHSASRRRGRQLLGLDAFGGPALGALRDAHDASGPPVRSVHDFNCLHVTAAELASPNRLRSAAGALPLDAPTLLVKEVAAADAARWPALCGLPRTRARTCDSRNRI